MTLGFKKLLIITVIILITSISFTCNSASNTTSVSIIINPKSSINKSTINQIKQTLSTHENFNISVYTTDEINSLNSNNTNYAISLGEEPAKKIISLNPDFPVIFTFISEEKTKNILRNNDKNKYHVISMIQPASRTLKLATLLLNKKAKIGLTKGALSRDLINDFKKEAKNKNISLVIKDTKNHSAPIDAMRDSLQESDLYIATYDPEILSRHTIKWLLYLAYKKNKPLIGYSEAYTRAGAVGAIFSSPKQLAKQSAEWIINLQNKNNLAEKTYPQYFTVSINQRTQRSLLLNRISSEEIKTEIIRSEKANKND